MKIPLEKINAAAAFRKVVAEAIDEEESARKFQTALELGTRETSARIGMRKAVQGWHARIAELGAQATKGNKAALELLYEVAFAAAVELAKQANINPLLVKQFAAKQVCWPIIMWPYTTQRQTALEGFENLCVGSELNAPVNLRPVFMQRENSTPARKWIANIVLQIMQLHEALYWGPVPKTATEEIEIVPPAGCNFTEREVISALNLPRLDSEEAQNRWLNFLWEYALRESGGTISEHPIIGEIGKTRANSDPAGFIKEDINSGERRTNSWERIAEAAIKRAIKDSLKSYSFL